MQCPASACNDTIAVCTAGTWQWSYSTVCPVCASPDTPIATPNGERRIADLRAGDLVYTVDDQQIRPVPIAQINRTPVFNHRVVRVTFAGGRALEISAGHPTADGRTIGDLRPRGELDRHVIESVEIIRYEHPYTYDILPASKSGAYFAAGVLIGSTLHVPADDAGHASNTRQR
jgi:hypothetical protein